MKTSTLSDSALSSAIKSADWNASNWADKIMPLLREKQRRQIIRRKNSESK